MKPNNPIDLEKIATDSSSAIIGAISVAREMGIFNDQQDLELLIRAGIMEALDQLILELDSHK
jgi:hypothetical protein